jgi:hypothetical protein
VLQKDAHVRDGIAGPALMHAPLELPPGQVGNRASAESSMHVDKFAGHT